MLDAIPFGECHSLSLGCSDSEGDVGKPPAVSVDDLLALFDPDWSENTFQSDETHATMYRLALCRNTNWVKPKPKPVVITLLVRLGSVSGIWDLVPLMVP